MRSSDGDERDRSLAAAAWRRVSGDTATTIQRTSRATQMCAPPRTAPGAEPPERRLAVCRSADTVARRAVPLGDDYSCGPRGTGRQRHDAFASRRRLLGCGARRVPSDAAVVSHAKQVASSGVARCRRRLRPSAPGRHRPRRRCRQGRGRAPPARRSRSRRSRPRHNGPPPPAKFRTGSDSSLKVWRAKRRRRWPGTSKRGLTPV
jgi:hypothetical protein